MSYFFVTWTIKKGLVIKAESFGDALINVQNRDVVHEGVYLDGSYKHEETCQLDEELIDVVKAQDSGEGLP